MQERNHAAIYFIMTDSDVEALPRMQAYLDYQEQIYGDHGIGVDYNELTGVLMGVVECHEGALLSKHQMEIVDRLREIQRQVLQMGCMEVDTL